jgi:hypothetical protein
LPDFTFAIVDQLGGNLADLRAPVTMTFTRNVPPLLQPILDLEEDAAATLVTALASGMPRLKAYRGGVLIANAPWAPMVETVPDGEPKLCQLAGAFRGPAAILEQRFVSEAVSFPATDAGTIAWSLITTSHVEDLPTGLRLGTILPSLTSDQEYAVNKKISEAIDDLTQLDGGPDIDVTPVDEGSICGAFNVYAQQGNDVTSTAIFECGPNTLGNVSGLTRQTTYPVNRVRVIGADGVFGEATNDISRAKYGTFMPDPVQALDISDQATLNARAEALIRPDPVRVISFTPDPALAPQPWDAYWLGDTTTFNANYGSVRESLTPRVNTIVVAIDIEGNIGSVILTVEQAI